MAPLLVLDTAPTPAAGAGLCDGYMMGVPTGKTVTVVAADSARTNLIVRNASDIWTVFVGPAATIAAGSGYPLRPGQSLTTKTQQAVCATVQDPKSTAGMVGVWWER